MIKKYPVADAEGKLARILGEVEGGTTVYLTGDDGASVVVIMSPKEYRRLAHGSPPAPPADAPTIQGIMAEFQEAFKIDGRDLDDAFEGIREESNGRGV